MGVVPGAASFAAMDQSLAQALRSGDADKVASFVRDLLPDPSAACALLRSAATALEAQAGLTASPTADEASPAGSPGAAAAGVAGLLSEAEFFAIPNLSLTLPRGRFNLIFSELGLSLRPSGKAGTSCGPVKWTDVQHILKVPKPDNYRKAGEPARAYLIVLVLRVPLQVGKQSQSCVVINADGLKPLPGAAALALDPAAGNRVVAARLRAALAGLGERASGPEHAAVAPLLAAGPGLSLEEPDSSICSAEWFKAYKGVNEGALYPMRSGLVFLPRPPLFMAAADIAEVSAGRGGGVHMGATNTDVIVKLHGGDEDGEAFSNFSRGDVPAILSYAGTLAKLAAKAAAGGAPGADDSSEEDEDFEDEEGSGDGDAGAAGSEPALPTRQSARTRKRGPPDGADAAPAPPASSSAAASSSSSKAARTTRGASSAAVVQDLPDDDALWDDSDDSDIELVM